MKFSNQRSFMDGCMTVFMIQSFFIIFKSLGLNAARVQVYKSGGLLVIKFASSTLTSLQASRPTWGAGMAQ